MLWGPADASIHFCEDKYTHLFWIAEYYNTISSLSYIIVGCGWLWTDVDGNAKVRLTVAFLIFSCIYCL